MASGNWRLVVCGINHKTSSLEQREPLQIGHDEIARANTLFTDVNGIQESLIVSTCNRVEFYFVAKKTNEPFELVKSFYREFKNLDISELAENFHTRKNKHVAAHLFSVTAGIDSMVLGENQVLGQLKDAYSSACAVKTTGKVIHRLFHQAFRVGKLVRSETEMGKGACSISSVSVDFLKTKIEKLGKPSILFVGINKMIALAASKIIHLNYDKLVFANRTVDKAVKFASKYNGSGHSLDELQSLLKTVDIVIACTGAKEPIITKQMIDAFISSNSDSKLTIMDMAVPRDVEITKNYHPNIEIYDLEDIKEHIKKHQQERELAIPQAQEIIDRKLTEFRYWFEHVRHEPVYNGLGDSFEAVRKQEMSKVLDNLSPQLRDEVENATKSMVKKLLQLKYSNQNKG